jgi:TOMM system kinase/cyclase fusion protein
VPFVRLCPHCGQQMQSAAKFCPECGTLLKATAKPVPAKRRQSAIPAGRAPRPRARSATAKPPVAAPEAERRQLTVMFCDLVGSTQLSAQLDPEDYRAVVQQYQQTCTAVIQRHDGYLAQYLGDGLLVYFGYPAAHEDDARRAVRTGLEIVEALRGQETRDGGQARGQPPQVRIGIHTGLVVIGDIGANGRTEQLALGETPNVAARLQGLAEPNTVLISAATQRLLNGQFDCQPLGSHLLKGVATPVALYCVQSERQNAASLAGRTTLMPLVGREEELALLFRRWEQVKERDGQVALLSGEPGIGKSRLVRELRERVEPDGALCLEFRCSPYHQNSALQPAIEHLQRVLQWKKDDPLQTKTDKLHTTLARYRFPQADTPALFAALLSLPQPADSPTLNLSPQRQKQKTEEALIAWLVEEAEHAPLYCVWEDLHWADPSTLELLGRLIDQAATARLFIVLTGRPEFIPPWGQHGHFSQLTLSRLGRRQVPQMIEKAAGGKPLPTEVVQQIVAKTDGVPLFVEELTKMVLESGLLTVVDGRYELPSPLPPLAIPSTLQDSLMARLDRLAATRETAQVGAVIGREFSYELLGAVSPLDEATLQQGLRQLVEAELVYQRGVPPRATYLFKHALVQDTAYHSLLKSKRQQYHQQIARALEARFVEATQAQPELLAHHYTEAGLLAQALPYWQQAGERASQRSAYVEAISHLTTGLELLKTLPDTPEHAQQELTLQILLGPVLIATKGFAAQEVEKTFTRARELCRQVGDTPQLFLVLRGLWAFYNTRSELQTARELGEQFLSLAKGVHDPALLLEAYRALGRTLFDRGELTLARASLEQGIALYDPLQHRSHAFRYGYDPGVAGLACIALVLWHLGYIDQALKRSREAVTLAQRLSHPYSLAFALGLVAEFHSFRRNWLAVQEHAEEAVSLSCEQGFPLFAALGTFLRGRAFAEQGRRDEGVTLMRQGLAAWRATGAEMWQSHFLALLAEAYGKGGQIGEGLTILAEALDFVHETGERYYEAELYRLKGVLSLQSWHVKTGQDESEVAPPQSPPPDPQAEAVECFWKAIKIARRQQAKSLELRASMSLARLWQQQGKQKEAYQLLSEIYAWFTEGFDTKDLQEAKALLEELT